MKLREKFVLSCCMLICGMLLCCSLTGCDTKNVGLQDAPGRGPVVTIVVPAGMYGGGEATWVANWVGGTAPYNISWDWGGGSEPNAASRSAIAGLTNSQTVTMRQPSLTDNSNYDLTVIVEDANGLSGTVIVAYVVGFGDTFSRPVITATHFAAGTLTVSVVDSDNEDVTVTINTPLGITAANTTDVVVGGNGDASFGLSAADIFNGASGDVQILATDSNGNTDTATQAVNLPGITLIADTLIAVPLTAAATMSDGDRATADGGVTIVVATGVPASPFQFMNGVGVTVAQDATYQNNTFNAGARGGAAGDVDGFWELMDPLGGFLLPPDNFIQSTDIGSGLERWDFNLTPIGGSDQTTAQGALFNFVMEFGAPGTYTLGFQQFETVNRTYYTDGDNNEYFWGNISNSDVPSSIVVVAAD